ncbi:MAG: hypothetical protein JSV31_08225 [Desulfobacterales bacterium]|jgi:hypothetical protein|nr:MAG: hypothetical protein JSV31_08225 [Desulfobacterales bacterium]
MVWVVEKKVFYHILDLGFESVGIPIRVKFEFEVQDGSFVPDSLSTERLYNQQELERRYPNLKLDALEQDIEKTIHFEILKYLKNNGYLKEESEC